MPRRTCICTTCSQQNLYMAAKKAGIRGKFEHPTKLVERGSRDAALHLINPDITGQEVCELFNYRYPLSCNDVKGNQHLSVPASRQNPAKEYRAEIKRLFSIEMLGYIPHLLATGIVSPPTHQFPNIRCTQTH